MFEREAERIVICPLGNLQSTIHSTKHCPRTSQMVGFKIVVCVIRSGGAIRADNRPFGMKHV